MIDPAYYYGVATLVSFLPLFIACFRAATHTDKQESGAGHLRAGLFQTAVFFFFVQLAVYVSVVGWKLFFSVFLSILALLALSMICGLLFAHASVGREIDSSR